MRVLITRPAAQAEATRAALEAAGHEALVDPVLEIRPKPADPLDLTDATALVVTSANATPALAGLPTGLPVFAVGAATAAAARAHGCASVTIGPGDGAGLAQLIARQLTAGTVLHLAGTEVKPGLEAGLRAAGIGYRRHVVYAARPVAELGPITRSALAQGTLGAVLFFSPRSAAVWCDLVRRAGLLDCLPGIVAAAISEDVAAELRDLAWADVRVAPERDQGSLLALLAPHG